MRDMLVKHGIAASDGTAKSASIQYTNEKGVAATTKARLVENATEAELIGTGIHKVPRKKETTYHLETKGLFKTVCDKTESFAIKGQKATRADLIQGCGILKLICEQRESTTDSSFSTYKIRKDGTQSGDKKNKDSQITVSLENILTGHMSGATLEGRIQKSVRTNLGAGLVLCQAMSARMKVDCRGSSGETKRLAEQALETSISTLRGKLNAQQMSVATCIKEARDPLQAKNAFASVASSLDAIFPKIDRPCVPHPVYLFKREGDEVSPLQKLSVEIESRSIYSSRNLEIMNVPIEAVRVPGYKDTDGAKQALMMASTSSVYGALGILEQFFGIKGKTRDDLVQELKNRFTGTVPGIAVKNANLITNNFRRGTPSAKNHQAIAHNPLKTKNQGYYVHDLPQTAATVRTTYVKAMTTLMGLLRDTNALDRERNEFLLANQGSEADASIDNMVGYFNRMTPQTEETRKNILKGWDVLKTRIARYAEDEDEEE